MNKIKNRFFTKNDKTQSKVTFDLEPKFFWSRLYEYIFALDMAKPHHTVLDCCTGTYHPLKFALAEKCKKVFACDLDNISKENILKEIETRFGKEVFDNFDKTLMNKIDFKQANVISLPYSDKKFDVLFCISALEHMDLDIVKKGLSEMKRCLKDNGKIVLTVDYPTLLPEKLIEIVESVGLIIDGDFDYSIPKDAIETDYFGGNLKCYAMVLKKVNK